MCRYIYRYMKLYIYRYMCSLNVNLLGGCHHAQPPAISTIFSCLWLKDGTRIGKVEVLTL